MNATNMTGILADYILCYIIDYENDHINSAFSNFVEPTQRTV